MAIGKVLSRVLHHAGEKIAHVKQKHFSTSARSAYHPHSKKSPLRHLEHRQHHHPDQIKAGHEHSPAARAVLHRTVVNRALHPQGLSPEQKQQVSHAVGEIKQNSQSLENAVGNSQSCPAGPVLQASPSPIVLKSSQMLKTTLEGKSPQVQQAILQQVQPDIGLMARNFSQLSDKDAQKAFANLSSVSESVGQDHVHLLTDTFAKNYVVSQTGEEDLTFKRFPTEFERRQQALLENGAQHAIKSGQGALFSVALTGSLEKAGKTQLAQGLRDNVLSSLEEVQKNYKSDRENFEKREGQLAITIANNPQYSDAQKMAGMESFREEHAEDYRAYDQSSKIFASTLSGTAALKSAYDDTSAQYPFNPHQKNQTNLRIDKAMENGMKEVPSLSQNQDGRKVLGEALLDEAQGQKTFLQQASQLASQDPKTQKTFDQAMLRTVGLEGESLVKRKQGGKVPLLLEGAGKITHNVELQKAFSEYAESLEKFSSEDFAGGLTTGADVAQLAQEAIKDKKLSVDLKDGFKLVGFSLGSAGLVMDIGNTIHDPNLENSLRTVVDAAGFSEAFLTKGLASSVAGKVNIVGQVGFSIWDTYSALQNGDKLGAATSSLPLLLGGAGLAFGPEGGAAGLVIGSAIDLGVDVGRAVFGKDPIEEFEKETQSFHEGALQEMGFSSTKAEELAHQLRDINKDLKGPGPLFADAAEVAGQSAQDWFKKITSLPDEDLHDLVKLSLRFVKEGEDASANMKNLQAKFLDKEMKYYQEHGKFSDEFFYAKDYPISEQLLSRWALCY